MPRTAVLPAFAAVLVSLGIVDHAHPGGLDAHGHHHPNDTGRLHRNRTVNADPDVQAPARKSRENLGRGATLPNYTALNGGARAFGS